MLEILALIYLTRKMGELAERKGVSKGNWKLFTVLAWFGAEILGIILGIVTGGTGPTLIFAYGFAIGSYFILKAILSKKPDVNDTNFEFEQQAP
jgi:hypothetical protein